MVEVTPTPRTFSFPSAPKRKNREQPRASSKKSRENPPGTNLQKQQDQPGCSSGPPASLQLSRDQAEGMSLNELLKAKLVKELLEGPKKKEDKTGEDDDNKADWVRITGSLTVEFASGKTRVIKIDEGGPDDLPPSLEARHFLRPPSGKPSSWWKKVDGLNKSVPVRGSGLNLSASMGSSRVHERTVKVLHCRNSAVNHKW